ncbi:hypothetical protein [Streptomyces sp. NPDC002324]
MNAAKLRNVDVATWLDFVHTTKTMRQDMADPNADYWSIGDVADYWGVTSQTIRTYRSRRRGELPEPDAVFGRSPVWKPKTIIDFERPGQGKRTDLA